MVDICRNGHERSEENASWSGGHLNCKACNREKSKRSRDRQRAAGVVRKRNPDTRQLAPRPPLAADLERLKNRLVVAENGCWVWQGSVNVRDGYGQARVGGRVRSVHRVIYEAQKGVVADGLVLDHLCRNPPCANPEHLDPVRQLVNYQRGAHYGAEMARTGKCKRGHEQTVENVRVQPNGRRRCEPCYRLAQIQRRARRAAAAKAGAS
jgi:hypothetical protein